MLLLLFRCWTCVDAIAVLVLYIVDYECCAICSVVHLPSSLLLLITLIPHCYYHLLFWLFHLEVFFKIILAFVLRYCCCCSAHFTLFLVVVLVYCCWIIVVTNLLLVLPDFVFCYSLFLILVVVVVVRWIFVSFGVYDCCWSIVVVGIVYCCSRWWPIWRCFVLLQVFVVIVWVLWRQELVHYLLWYFYNSYSLVFIVVLPLTYVSDYFGRRCCRYRVLRYCSVVIVILLMVRALLLFWRWWRHHFDCCCSDVVPVIVVLPLFVGINVRCSVVDCCCYRYVVLTFALPYGGWLVPLVVAITRLITTGILCNLRCYYRLHCYGDVQFVVDHSWWNTPDYIWCCICCSLLFVRYHLMGIVYCCSFIDFRLPIDHCSTGGVPPPRRCSRRCVALRCCTLQVGMGTGICYVGAICWCLITVAIVGSILYFWPIVLRPFVVTLLLFSVVVVTFCCFYITLVPYHLIYCVRWHRFVTIARGWRGYCSTFRLPLYHITTRLLFRHLCYSDHCCCTCLFYVLPIVGRTFVGPFIVVHLLTVVSLIVVDLFVVV